MNDFLLFRQFERWRENNCSKNCCILSNQFITMHRFYYGKCVVKNETNREDDILETFIYILIRLHLIASWIIILLIYCDSNRIFFTLSLAYSNLFQLNRFDLPTFTFIYYYQSVGVMANEKYIDLKFLPNGFFL